MLGQPVPNPLAKNPNFNTTKVFAAVGIILIVIIIISGGIWYLVQSAEDRAGTVDDNTVIKTATTSAKQKSSTNNQTCTTTTAETANWKCYQSSIGHFELKYPPDLPLDDSNSGFVSYLMIGNGVPDPTFIVTVKTTSDSSSKPLNSVVPATVGGKNAYFYDLANTQTYIASNGGLYYTIELNSTNAGGKKTLETILSTFKFL